MLFDPTYHAGILRDVLLALAAVAAFFAARQRWRAALVTTLGFALAGTAFWLLVLARPYGVLVDPGTTLRAADCAVAASAGGRDGLLIGEPSERKGCALLARAGVPARVSLVLPSVVPTIALLAIALTVGLLVRPVPAGALAAVLWIALGTRDLDAMRGLGFVSGAWSHPRAALVLAVLVPIVLVAARRLPRAVAVAFAVALMLDAAWWCGPGEPLGAADAFLATLVDALPLTLLGVVAFARHRDAPALGFGIGGLTAILLSVTSGGTFDGWFGAVALRLGLVLAVVPLVQESSLWLDHVVSSRRPAWRGGGSGVVVFLLLAGSFLARWDPARLDPHFSESEQPIADHLFAAMEFVRTQTPKGAVIVAGPDYAPLVAAFGERRVVRAPTLLTAADDERRQRAERAVLMGRGNDALVAKYGIAYVFVAPGDFREYLEQTDDLEGRPGLVRRYGDDHGIRVFEVRR